MGDTVVVHQETSTNVEMKVVGRTWKQAHKYEPHILHVELGLSSQFANITAFENFLVSRGFPRS